MSDGYISQRNPQEGQIKYVTDNRDGSTPYIYLGGKWHQYGPTVGGTGARKNYVGEYTPSQELLSLLTTAQRYTPSARNRNDWTNEDFRRVDGPINQYINAHDYNSVGGLLNMLNAVGRGDDLSNFLRVTGDPGDAFRGSRKDWGYSYQLGTVLNALLDDGRYVPGYGYYDINAPAGAPRYVNSSKQKINDDQILGFLDAIGRLDVLYGYKREAGAPTREALYKYYDQIKSAFPDADIPTPDQLALQTYKNYVKGEKRGYVESFNHEKLFADTLNKMLNVPEIVEARGGKFDVMAIPEISKLVADGQAQAAARLKARRDREKAASNAFTGMGLSLALSFAGMPGINLGGQLGAALGASGWGATALGNTLLHTGGGLLSGKDFSDALLGGAASGILPALGGEILSTTWGDLFGTDGAGLFQIGDKLDVGKGLAETAIGSTLGTGAGMLINQALAQYAADQDFEKFQKQINAIYAEAAKQQQQAYNTQMASGIESPGWGSSVSFGGAQQQPQGTGPGTQFGTSIDAVVSPNMEGRVMSQGGEGGMGTEEAMLFDAPEGQHYADPYQTTDIMPGQAGLQNMQRANRAVRGGWGSGVSFV